MKKLIGILMPLLILTSFACAEEYYDGNYHDFYQDEDYYYEENIYEYYDDFYDPECVWVMLNGSYIWFDTVDACEISGSIFVPMREMFNQLNAEVEWDNDTQTATGISNNTTVVFTIGDTTYTVNGEVKTLPVAPQIKNGCIMLPLRALSEALGAEVFWNDRTKEVEISYLRPLSADEQYLYDFITSESTPPCQQTGTFKMSLVDNGADLNLNMDITSIRDGNYSCGTIKLTGDMYRKVLSIDADIKMWALTDGDTAEVYYSVNGSEPSEDIFGLNDIITPVASLSNISKLEKDALYSMFNSLEITSVKSQNGQKIISANMTDGDEYIQMSNTYYFNEKTNLPSRIVIDMSPEYADIEESENTVLEISPIDIKINYNVKMPEKPDFLKQ